MSGIYIPGMELPISCGYCRLRHADNFHGDACSVKIGLWCEFQKRPEDCPLVPVPAHGKMIIRDGEVIERDGSTDVRDYGKEIT